MPSTRVYEIAKRIGVDSRVLLLYLRANGVSVRSATSRLDDDLVQELLSVRDFQVKTVAIKQAEVERIEAAAGEPVWWRYRDDDWADDEPIWVGPEELTTREAGRAVGVTASTIRQWVAQGHLAPVGKRGRAHLFASRDVMATKELTQARTRVPVRSDRPVQSGRRSFASDALRGTTAANITDLVTAREAAYSAGVAEATVRAWVHRDLLKPAGRRGRANLFVRLHVIRLARRPHHRPKRKPGHF